MAEVLLVDDDPSVGVLLEVQLRALGHRVRTRRSLADALLAAVERRADVLLLDLDLDGDRTGDELLALLDRGVGRPRLTCLLSGADADQLAAVAARAGARWLRKPVDPVRLAQVLAEVDAADRADRARGPSGVQG